MQCGQLYDMDTTNTRRCPACQPPATAARNARAPRQERGYDATHDQVRAKLLRQWTPGTPCALCGKPTYDKTRLDLAHNTTRTGWRGLAHRLCNRSRKYD